MNYTTIILSCILHIILVLIFESVFLFGILYPILLRIADDITTNISNQFFNYIFRITNNNSLSPEQIMILKSGAVSEKIYLTTANVMPYIVFAFLELSLVFLGIIILLIASHMNIKIDYSFIIINSIIVFALICGVAFFILWSIVFTQPYTLDINVKLYKTFLDMYNSV